jgi:hypothetical protein
MNPGGQLANTTRPLKGSGQRTEWLPAAEVAYGFQGQGKRRELECICTAVPGEQILAKVPLPPLTLTFLLQHPSLFET